MQVEIEKDMDQKYMQPENTSKRIALLSVKEIRFRPGVF